MQVNSEYVCTATKASGVTRQWKALPRQTWKKHVVQVIWVISNDDSSNIFIGPRCPWGPINGSEPMSLTDSQTFTDLIDVTLADEDINSIPTDDVNRAILGNVAMQN